MSELVADCPRCDAEKMTFDLLKEHFLRQEYGWQFWYEAFCICRHCKKATIFVLSQKVGSDHQVVYDNRLSELTSAVNEYMDIEGYINLKDMVTIKPPEYLPSNIEAAFKEGATCMSVGCFNAAGTMFRLCLDLATRSKLPEEGVSTGGLNTKIRRDLGLRLPWLFDNKFLPEDLKGLSSCVKEDGNDGAHAGSLKAADAEDLLDFTIAVLGRLYTEPERLRLAQQRRDSRRAGEGKK